MKFTCWLSTLFIYNVTDTPCGIIHVDRLHNMYIFLVLPVNNVYEFKTMVAQS